MAVVDTNSTELDNVVASPVVKNDVHNIHGRLRIKSAAITSAAGDDDGSVYRFVRVKSSDHIKSIRLIHDGLGTSTYDVGLYTVDSGAVVDIDLYADGVSLATASPATPPTATGGSGVELRFADASTATAADINNAVWEDLGLSEDPGLEYDLCLTGVTVGTGGELGLQVIYTAGD